MSTYWDDRNTLDGDGYSSTWSIETGFTWSGGSSAAPDVWGETWGDGKRYSSLATFLDDENTSNGDGCNATCSVETGWTWSGGTKYTGQWAKDFNDHDKFKRHGLGTLYSADGQILNQGKWDRDKYEGKDNTKLFTFECHNCLNMHTILFAY